MNIQDVAGILFLALLSALACSLAMMKRCPVCGQRGGNDKCDHCRRF